MKRILFTLKEKWPHQFPSREEQGVGLQFNASNPPLNLLQGGDF